MHIFNTTNSPFFKPHDCSSSEIFNLWHICKTSICPHHILTYLLKIYTAPVQKVFICILRYLQFHKGTYFCDVIAISQWYLYIFYFFFCPWKYVTIMCNGHTLFHILTLFAVHTCQCDMQVVVILSFSHSGLIETYFWQILINYMQISEHMKLLGSYSLFPTRIWLNDLFWFYSDIR